MSVVAELAHGIATVRIGAVTDRVQEAGHGSEQALSVFLDAGVVPRSTRMDNHNQLGGDLEKYQLVQPGDLVFNRLRTWQGGFGASSHRGIVSPAYIVARPRSGDATYLNYVLHSAPYLAELTRISKWMPPSQFDVLWADLRNVLVPWLSVDEQRRIADFLDDRVARIDQAISARKAQAAALEFSYTAWLGEFLDALGQRYGWVPLRRFEISIEQGWSPEADSVRAQGLEPGVLKLGAVRGGAFKPGENKAFLREVVPRDDIKVRNGDLLVTRANTPSLVGDAAVVAELGDANLYLSDLIYRLTPKNYGALLASAALRGPRARQLIGVVARGTSGSMPKLRGEDLLAIEVPTAPQQMHRTLGHEDVLQRQQRDQRVQALQESMGLLTEYKQSLITAAVTGELDVTTARSGVTE